MFTCSLGEIRPVLLVHRRQQQSGFMPGCSTCDRILTMNLIAQRWRPIYAAYVDLRSAFDSISRPALWLFSSRFGIPSKIIHLMKSLYKQSVSCVVPTDCKVNGSRSLLVFARAVLLHQIHLLWVWIGSWKGRPSTSIRVHAVQCAPMRLLAGPIRDRDRRSEPINFITFILPI